MKAVFCGCDADAAGGIRVALRLRWPDTQAFQVETGSQVLESARESNSDLIFLDAGLLRAEGLELLTAIRAKFDGPVIVLAHQPSEAELLEILDAGADDYLPMTASAAQLVARVCAALRRAGVGAGTSDVVASCGELTVDSDRHEAYVGDWELYLTPTEFKLLHHLAQNSGKLVTHEALHKLVWGSEDKLYIDSLRKYVERLRKKLHAAPNSDIRILSVPGIGYRLLHPDQ